MTDNLLALETKAADPAKYSVQGRAEAQPYVPMGSDVNGGMFWVMLGQQTDETPPWNALYPNRRDRYLKQFSREEPLLAGAIQSMKTRIQTLNTTVNGPPRAKKFAQELLNKPGLGDNLIQVVGKFIDDLLTSDNGGFIELWRPGKPTSDASNRPVLGFAHLDSRQCWRSFDPEFPVWYTDPIHPAEIRKIHRSRVIMQSANPQPIELARNIGFSPVSQVLRMSRIIRNMMTYTDEKISGRFTRAIGAISGVSAGSVRKALREEDDAADQKGFVIYKGIPFLIQPSTESGSEIKLAVQDLASLPDGFKFESDITLYAYILALCMGVDAREFWPATQSGATKGDATVQNMKARGRMIGYLVQVMEWVLRQCLPETVEFEYDYTDDEQDEMQTRIQAQRQGIYSTALRDGGINNLEYRALLIADNIIDGRLLQSLDLPVTTADAANQDDEDDALEANTQDTAEPQDANDQQAAASLKAVHSGVMAALYVPAAIASDLYDQVAPALVKAGIVPVPPSDYHVTLVYAGDVSFYDDGERRELQTGVAEIAIQSTPLPAQLSGIGRFMTDQGDATHPLYISVDSASLPEFRQRLFDRLKFHLAIEQNHGFTPHITIGYIPAEQDTPLIPLQPLSLQFDALTFAWGNTVTQYPLGIGDVKMSAALKSVGDYRRSLRSLVRGYWKGDLGAFDFVDGVASAITRHFTQAWEEGAKKFGVTSDEMTDAEKTRLLLEINTEISYILPFADAVEAGSKANGGLLSPLFDRAELWVNNYGRIVSLAGSMAAADAKAIWEYGDTIDHCLDCSTYAGRVYRNSVWRKWLEPYDALPRGRGLACNGYNCDCGFKPTSEPVSKGRPPLPVGAKKSHKHPPVVRIEAVAAYA